MMRGCGMALLTLSVASYVSYSACQLTGAPTAAHAPHLELAEVLDLVVHLDLNGKHLEQHCAAAAVAVAGGVLAVGAQALERLLRVSADARRGRHSTRTLPRRPHSLRASHRRASFRSVLMLRRSFLVLSSAVFVTS